MELVCGTSAKKGKGLTGAFCACMRAIVPFLHARAVSQRGGHVPGRMVSPSFSGISIDLRRSPRVAAALAVVRPATVSHSHVCVHGTVAACGFAGCPRRPPPAPAHQRMRPKNAPRMQAQNATVRPFPFFAEVPHGIGVRHLRKKRERSHWRMLRLHGRNYALLARTRSLLAWGPWVPRLLAPTAQRALQGRYRDL